MRRRSQRRLKTSEGLCLAGAWPSPGMGLLVVPHQLGAWQGTGGATPLRDLYPATLLKLRPREPLPSVIASAFITKAATTPAVSSLPWSCGMSALLPQSVSCVGWWVRASGVCFWCSLLSCDFVLQKLTCKSSWPSLRGSQRAGKAGEERGGSWGGGKHWGEITQSSLGVHHIALREAENSGPVGILQTRLPDAVTWF